MKKIRKVSMLLLITILMLVPNKIMATTMQEAEYSERYKWWLSLSDEEKANTLMPSMYEVPSNKPKKSNIISKSRALRAGASINFNLKNVIPANVTIRNQLNSDSCWAFSALSALETNLALTNYHNGVNTSKIYDFSERHMEYSMVREFKNNQINSYGLNRTPGSGGSWYFAQAYLTNGSGAIEEEQMPFENNKNVIDISKIENKTVSAQVYDTIEFADYQKLSGTNKTEAMNAIKEHIQNYGAVFANMHAVALNDTTSGCYNNKTGAIYCNSYFTHSANHAISIVGWDDNYSIDNFGTLKPSSKGAWIVRNSWGEKTDIGTLSEYKTVIFKANEQYCKSQGWNSGAEIPDQYATQIAQNNGYIVENGTVKMTVGDNGYCYISYEDCNVSFGMYGIVKAKEGKNYENIYQYDENGASTKYILSTNKVWLYDIYNKKTTGKEYINQVAIHAPQTYICKVYVNANGTDITSSSMKQVKLKSGDTKTIGTGYHILEFEKPIEVTGNNFCVMLEIDTPEDQISFSAETNSDGMEWYKYTTIETGKCFVGTGDDIDSVTWTDLGKIQEVNKNTKNIDSTLKAFTVSKLEDTSLKNIELATAPSKTNYVEGQNFDKTGMVIKANYNNDTSEILDSSSYSITNGTNLVVGQTSVTVTYNEKSIEVPITVEKNAVTQLQITNMPSKTSYKEGQNFDNTGMVVMATFKDGTSKNVTDYEIVGGNNLEQSQTYVTITYEEKSAQVPITVTANALVSIKISKIPNKTKYVVGQNFNTDGMIITGVYQDGDENTIENYTIEDGQNLKLGQTTVTITYQTKSVMQAITVEAKTITEIAINKMPTKTTYIQNKESLDLTGGELKISYNDGMYETILLTDNEVQITGFNNKILGKNTISVTYKNYRTEFDIEIIKEIIAVNSNFSNASCKVNNMKIYTFTDNRKSYTLIDATINGIQKAEENESYEYFYYVSSRADEKNITDWIKVDNGSIQNGRLNILINSNDIKNYEDMAEAENLYIYVKETVTKSGDQATTVSKPMRIDPNTEIKTYIDNIEKTDFNSGDSTTANGTIPNAGISNIVIFIAVIAGFGIFVFIKYKKISEDVK